MKTAQTNKEATAMKTAQTQTADHVNSLIALEKALNAEHTRHTTQADKNRELIRAAKEAGLTKLFLSDREALFVAWYAPNKGLEKIRQTPARERTEAEKAKFKAFDGVIRQRYARLVAALKKEGIEIEKNTQGGERATKPKADTGKPANDQTISEAIRAEKVPVTTSDNLHILAITRKLAALYSPELNNKEYQAFIKVIGHIEDALKDGE